MKETPQNIDTLVKIEFKESAQTVVTSRCEYRKFNKMTKSLKRSLVRLIIDKNCSIKKAGLILNLSYSSAKSAFFEFKKESENKFKGNQAKSTLQCGYKDIEASDHIQIILQSSTATNIVSQKQLIFQEKNSPKTQYFHSDTSSRNYEE